MRVARLVLFAFAIVWWVSAAAQKEDWAPLNRQDLELKEVPGETGGSAIQLYYADFIYDSTHSEFIYHRIKVLNEKGRDKYSDIEIEAALVVDRHVVRLDSDLREHAAQQPGLVVAVAVAVGKNLADAVWTQSAYSNLDGSVAHVVLGKAGQRPTGAGAGEHAVGGADAERDVLVGDNCLITSRTVLPCW
jgi:hypothetical protein